MPQHWLHENQWEQLPVPDPVRAETLNDVKAAQNTITITWCDTSKYNECTLNFESQRAECREQSCNDRLALAQDMWIDWGSETVQELSVFWKTENVLSSTMLRFKYWNEVIDNWFDTHGNILGYNNEDGNYVITQTEFEDSLKVQNPEEWNSLAVANYFTMLQDMWTLSISYLLSTMGSENLASLKNIWSWESHGLAKTKLIENPETSWLINWVSSIDYNSLLNNINDFEEVAVIFDKLSKEEKNSIIDTAVIYFVENPESINTINISWSNESLFNASILKARNIIGARSLINVYISRYQWWPEVAGLLSAIIEMGAQGDGENFKAEDFETINDIITEYNNENDTEYPPINREQLLFQIVSLSENSQSAEAYQAKMVELIASQEVLSSLYRKRIEIIQRLRNVQRMGETEAIISIQVEKDEIDREIYQMRGDIGRQEEQLDDLWQKLQSEIERIQWIKNSMIQHDLNDEKIIDDIKKNPDNYFSKINTLERYHFFIENYPESFTDLWISKVNFRLLDSKDAFYEIITSFPWKIDKLSHLDASHLLASTYQNSDKYATLIISLIEKWGYSELKRKLQTGDEKEWEALGNIHKILQNVTNKSTNVGWAETDLGNYLTVETNSLSSSDLIEQANALMEAEDYWVEALIKNRLVKFFSSCDLSSNVNAQDTLKILIQAWKITPYDLSINMLEDTSPIFEIEGEALPLAFLFLQSPKDIDKNFQKLPHKVQIDSKVIWHLFQISQSFPTEKIDILGIINEINIYSWKEASQLIEILMSAFPEWETANINIPRWFIDKALLIIENLSEDDKKLIFDNPNNTKEKEKYDIVVGFIQNYLVLEEQIQKARVSLSEKNDQSLYLEEIQSFMKDSKWWEFRGNNNEVQKDMDEFIRLMQEWSTLSSQEAMDLIKRNIPLEKQASFTSWLVEILNTKLNRDVEEAKSTWLSQNEIWELSDNIRIFISSETWDIEEQKLLAEFNIFKRSYLDSNHTPQEIAALFILSLKTDWDSQETNDVISKLETILKAVITKSGNDAAADSNGQYLHDDDFWKNYNQNFREKDLIYSPPQEIPTNSWDNNQSQDNTWENTSYLKNDYIWVEWEDRLTSKSWKTIPLSPEDIIMLKKNPEIKDDIVWLHAEFMNTWLERMYPHKDAIFKSMWNQSWLKFNSKGWWYVDSREANELFSTILYITTENPKYKETGLSLVETKASIVRETHWVAGENNVEVTWKQGNKLEKSFIDKFTMRNRWDVWKFNYTAFSKALKWDFSPSPQ